MNKITDKARKEALGIINGCITYLNREGVGLGTMTASPEVFRTLRSALEPKTVTREWAHLKLLDILMPEGRQVTVIFEEMFKELGIEITEK